MEISIIEKVRGELESLGVGSFAIVLLHRKVRDTPTEELTPEQRTEQNKGELFGY